jgi:hypothetical protein
MNVAIYSKYRTLSTHERANGRVTAFGKECKERDAEAPRNR